MERNYLQKKNIQHLGYVSISVNVINKKYYQKTIITYEEIRKK